MNFSTFKKLAVTSAVALTLAAGSAQAQDSAQIGATFSTAAGITATAGNVIDFGTWVVNNTAPDTVTLALPAVTAGNPALPTPGGVVDPTTTIINTVLPGPGGNVLVQTATPLALQIQGNVTTDFGDPALSLGTLVFTDSNDTNTVIPAAFDGATFADTTVANTDETIGIGGTLTISGNTATNPGTFNDALVDIDFTF